MQVNGLSGAGSKTAGIKMAQKMDSFSSIRLSREEKNSRQSGDRNGRQNQRAES